MKLLGWSLVISALWSCGVSAMPHVEARANYQIDCNADRWVIVENDVFQVSLVYLDFIAPQRFVNCAVLCSWDEWNRIKAAEAERDRKAREERAKVYKYVPVCVGYSPLTFTVVVYYQSSWVIVYSQQFIFLPAYYVRWISIWTWSVYYVPCCAGGSCGGCYNNWAVGSKIKVSWEKKEVKKIAEDADKSSSSSQSASTSAPVSSDKAAPTSTVTPAPTSTVTPAKTSTVTSAPTSTVTPAKTSAVTSAPTSTVTPAVIGKAAPNPADGAASKSADNPGQNAAAPPVDKPEPVVSQPSPVVNRPDNRPAHLDQEPAQNTPPQRTPQPPSPSDKPPASVGPVAAVSSSKSQTSDAGGNLG